MPSSRRRPQTARLRGEVDLHTHTTASDGLLEPAALVAHARARGLRTIAVTDHDSIEGVAEAQRAGASMGIDVIAGTELSAKHEDQEVHVLVYYLDPTSHAWRQALLDQRRRREARAERIVERLERLGAPIDMERVRELAGAGAIGRPHIARALVARGHARSASEAFARWLGTDKEAFVSVASLSADDAVALVRDLGGAAAIAHPAGLFDLNNLVARLSSLGLAGLECYYSQYRAGVRSALVSLAGRNHLVATGGSDFHGGDVSGPRQLGAVSVPADVPKELLARARCDASEEGARRRPVEDASEMRGCLAATRS